MSSFFPSPLEAFTFLFFFMGFCSHSHPSSFVTFFLFLSSSFYSTGQAQPELSQARHLDSLLRNLAFRCYGHSDHPKTGQIFPLRLPTNLSRAASAATARYRSGSLHRYGAQISEFLIAPGATIQPYVERLVVVRQRLDNSSSDYYKVPGYRLLSPVLGLLFYNGDQINAADPSELQISATKRPILIDFSNLTGSVPAGAVPACAFWDLNGNVRLMGLGGGGFASARICLGYKEGHYGLLMEEEKASARAGKWKLVVGSAVGGAMGALLLGLLVMALVKKKKKKLKMAEMERRAYEEEALQVSMVGHVRAPVAAGVRTLPVLENSYAP